MWYDALLFLFIRTSAISDLLVDICSHATDYHHICSQSLIPMRGRTRKIIECLAPVVVKLLGWWGCWEMAGSRTEWCSKSRRTRAAGQAHGPPEQICLVVYFNADKHWFEIKLAISRQIVFWVTKGEDHAPLPVQQWVGVCVGRVFPIGVRSETSVSRSEWLCCSTYYLENVDRTYALITSLLDPTIPTFLRAEKQTGGFVLFQTMPTVFVSFSFLFNRRLSSIVLNICFTCCSLTLIFFPCQL